MPRRVLAVWGVLVDGHKVLLHLAPGSKEDTAMRCACQHQTFTAKLTPGGGLLESGTKKSGDSGWLGSTR